MLRPKGFNCVRLMHKYNKNNYRCLSTAAPNVSVDDPNGTNLRIVIKNIGKPLNSKLQFLVDFFPGKTALSKVAVVSSVTAASLFLVHNGYYIPGEDTYALAGFATFARVFYMKLGKPIHDYLGNEVWSERETFIKRIEEAKENAHSNLNILESFRDNLDVNAALFEMKKENVKLEAQVAELSQQHQFMSSIKAKLQEMVAKEKQRRDEERKAFLAAVHQELHGLLQTPQIQDRIMEQALKNLETLPINAV